MLTEIDGYIFFQQGCNFFLFVCLIVCLFLFSFVCLFDCLFVCFSVCLFVCLFVCFFVVFTGRKEIHQACCTKLVGAFELGK